ncbi:MAG TPA: DUF192 domain-containing protein [Myxococcota bacterium]|nr:DUF192 domain-containing protein [Myxococcota bacterium]
MKHVAPLRLLAAFALVLMSLLSACKDTPAAGPTAPAPTAPVTRPGPKVVFPTKSGPIEVSVVIARTSEELQRGLMFVDKLEAGRGMLFLMPERRIQRFWMKNTYIPLDMIFIDEDLKVVGLVENAEPHSETSRFVDHPSRYVLEVRGGYAKKVGIEPGQTVSFVGVPL